MNTRRTPSNHPKNLLDSKWTAMTPRDKEKHFVVVRLVVRETGGASTASAELRSVFSGRMRFVACSDLEDPELWGRGWL